MLNKNPPEGPVPGETDPGEAAETGACFIGGLSWDGFTSGGHIRVMRESDRQVSEVQLQ